MRMTHSCSVMSSHLIDRALLIPMNYTDTHMDPKAHAPTITGGISVGWNDGLSSFFYLYLEMVIDSEEVAKMAQRCPMYSSLAFPHWYPLLFAYLSFLPFSFSPLSPWLLAFLPPFSPLQSPPFTCITREIND